MVKEDFIKKFPDVKIQKFETETLLSGKNGADCYSKNGHAVTVLTRKS